MIPYAVAPDPASVVAGWIPVVLIAVLAIACFFLFRSFRRQVRKIDIPEGGIPTRGTRSGDPGSLGAHEPTRSTQGGSTRRRAQR